MTKLLVVAAMVPLIGIAATASGCDSTAGFPASYEIFSSSFWQPAPPLIESEFTAHWNQHKWDPDRSDIRSGYIYSSPSNRKVRVDEVWEANFRSSLFDYTHVSSDGLVSNSVYWLAPNIAATPALFNSYVNPALPLLNPPFPLFSEDVLVVSNAVFGGIVSDEFNGKVACWDILYEGSNPVTVYLDPCNNLVGYEFYSTRTRTRVITRYFNVVTGPINPSLFDFPQ